MPPDDAPAPPRPRLGLLSGSLDSCTAPIRTALETALRLLDENDWQTDERNLDLQLSHDAWLTIFAAETASSLTPFLGDRVDETSADTRQLLLRGAAISADEYLQARDQGRTLAAAVDSALTGVDALLTPTVPSPPASVDPEPDDEAYFGEMRWTVIANLTGHPAITIPTPGTALAGLQLIGRKGADGTLLSLAAQLEAAFQC
jgi:Asp-tRNA(Asn)/Glu-tRNA(Gln) amidotransferase A subunit family amidase